MKIIRLLFLRWWSHLDYCQECERWFDVRSGCESDIRLDERQKIVNLINGEGEDE